MCSLEEAWGDFNTGKYNPGGVTPGLVQQQITMDNQRGPDKPGDLYTQSNDRRQWAQPAADTIYPTRELMAKPAPEANGLSRGVHSKYSREKRIDSRNHPDQGGLNQLQTDVDVNYYKTREESRPAYLDLYEKPFMEIGGVSAPMPANMIGSVGQDLMTTTTSTMPVNTPDNRNEAFAMVPVGNKEASKSKFTPEFITNSQILTDAMSNNKTGGVAGSGVPLPLHLGNNPVHTVDAIRNIQEQLKALMTKMETLERKVTMVEHDKSHDIVLFIVIAIFVLFVLDNIFRKSRA